MIKKLSSKYRIPDPDPMYNSVLLNVLIIHILKNGKKTLSRKIVYECIKFININADEAIKTLEKAIKKVTPLVEVKSRRIGGSTYQVPIEVKIYRGINLAFRWIIKSAKKRPGKSMSMKLANEIIDAANGVGNSIRKKEEAHKMAEANKAFAHYRY
nr:ribosomal protein S7 [Cyanidium sp. THAL103]